MILELKSSSYHSCVDECILDMTHSMFPPLTGRGAVPLTYDHYTFVELKSWRMHCCRKDILYARYVCTRYMIICTPQLSNSPGTDWQAAGADTLSIAGPT